MTEAFQPPSETDENTRQGLEADWERWVPEMFPGYVSDEDGRFVDFADHQRNFWDHLWSVRSGERPRPFVAIWPRGHAKSTSIEMGVVALGARRISRYVLYVCGTQDQADDHVANIGDLLSRPSVARYYPELARPLVGKTGQSRGWRRNRLRTAAGFTIDAIGLDTARARGAKLEDARPDVIIFDDLDDEADSLGVVEKKILAITRKILPAGAEDLAVIAVQNLVHEDSIFQRFTDGRAKFLADRIVSGPVPAVEDLEYEELADGSAKITHGTATWAGMNVSRCERIIKDEGLESFLVERQHVTDAPAGDLVYRRSRVDAALDRGDEVEGIPWPEAEQFIAIDPGFSKRCAMLAIQERGGDRAELWKEWSFTRCEDDHIAEVAAAHILDWRVSWVYYDSESPELAKAIKKHVRKLCRERNEKTNVFFQGVPFNKYKRLGVKTTRWLLQQPNTVSWRAQTTEVHVPSGAEEYSVSEEASIFRREIRGYKLVPGTDEPMKDNDHGPDAWTAYSVRWIKRWLKSKKREKEAQKSEPTPDKDWIPDYPQ